MRVTRTLVSAAGAVVLATFSGRDAAALVQSADPSLLDIEVSDSIGLPLPNARLELFTYMDRGVFREWVSIEAGMLAEGIHLLRFSHEGHRPSVFSVPLRKGSRVSLRVRLLPEPATLPRQDLIEATEVRAVGFARDGRRSVDIIGGRRVIDRTAIERANGRPVGDILRLATGTNLTVTPSAGGFSHVATRTGSGRDLCEASVMLNGDQTLTLSFNRFEELYHNSEPEAIEIVLNGHAIPYTFRRTDSDCTVLLIWLRGR